MFVYTTFIELQNKSKKQFCEALYSGWFSLVCCFYIQCCKGLNQNLLLHQCYKIHIFNVGVEPSIFNWSVLTSLPRKPPKDRSSSTHTSTSPSGAVEKAVVSCIEDADFTSTCPSGSEEMAVMSTCIEKDGYFESKEAEV